MTIRVKNQTGRPLEDVLNKEMLQFIKNKRYLYVISANSDNIGKQYTDERIYKFGQGRGPKRLLEYLYFYGYHKKSNKCSGVKIHYLMTQQYSPLVHHTNTKVHRIEKKLKQYTKINELRPRGRGDERVKIRISKLFKVLNQKGYKALKDVIIPNPHMTRSRAKRQLYDAVS